MKLLHRYVLREWSLPFICAHVVLTCLLLLEDAHKNAYLFLGAGVSFAALLGHYAYLALSLTPLVLPIATFAASLFTFGKLHGGNEIAAMKCGGISLLGIAKPIVACGVVIGAINFFLGAFAAPMAADRVEQFMAQVKSKAGRTAKLSNVGFRNGFANRIWFLQRLDETSGTAENVTVSCHGDGANERERICAKWANFSRSDGCWNFRDCTVTAFDELAGKAVAVDRCEARKFTEFTESPKIMAASVKKIRNVSLPEILDAVKFCGSGGTGGIFFVKLHGLFAASVNCVLMLFFAIPFPMVTANANAFVSMAKASSLLLLILVLKSVLAVLGSSGVLAPSLAVWLPTALLLVAAVKFFRKAL
jgi:lipopolysaccharide export LptBFGC system permease protein LptF